MKQLAQRLRDGTMEVLDVAAPSVRRGSVLVQNHFSLISAGTEGSTVATARKSLLGKMRERPAQVRQVIDSLKQQGLRQTYRAVSKRLDAYSPLGYSSAGVVVDVGADVSGFSTGDRVACSGLGYANHAEMVSVPANLCVRLPATADLARASYNTLGAIALQGVRQADLRIGESCVVIGLGLLGQLTCLILRASGVKVIGLDINAAAVATAERHCADRALTLSDPMLLDALHVVTHGIDADAVIITAATDSTEPVNLAGRLLRKRGTVVIVGKVPTGFEREPDYYRKELSLKMSCSYGPGRYDPIYEEKGVDYPAGYVRWTENRNMRAFQDLVHTGTINADYMTTHRFPIEHATNAYELILNRSEEFLGILIEYDATKALIRDRISIPRKDTAVASQKAGIGFVGAGSYAMSHLLPNFKRNGRVTLTGVATLSGTSSRTVAEKFGFCYAASSPQDVIADDSTSTIVIATRHDSHAAYVIEALRLGKHVFVEKPLCLKPDELKDIQTAWYRHQPLLMVGFNRRFSPFTHQLKQIFADGPMAMIYRINAGPIPKDSWIQDKDLGGGRIIGEVCHFVDFMVFMNGSLPVRVHASALRDPFDLEDTVTINVTFENGSIGTICYFANGAKGLPKEYVEIYKGGVVARLVDFREIEVLGNAKPMRQKTLSQDKGQPAMTRAVAAAVTGAADYPVPLRESLASTAATFAILHSLRSGQATTIEMPDTHLTEARGTDAL
jgi:polar amino acid transport system substrate-binding protein